MFLSSQPHMAGSHHGQLVVKVAADFRVESDVVQEKLKKEFLVYGDKSCGKCCFHFSSALYVLPATVTFGIGCANLGSSIITACGGELMGKIYL